jgi:hypothetical protein
VTAKQRLAEIAKQISADPECDAHWQQAGVETVAVIRECVLWHKQRGRDPLQVMDKMLRVLDAIT